MSEMDLTDEVSAEDRELVERLAKLQDMHQQISDLRGLLPERLLRPTRIALENPRSVSPEKLAASLRMAASDGSRDIQRFKKDFYRPEMRDLWQKTSNADFGQGRDSWTVDYQTLVKTFNTTSQTGDVKVSGSQPPNITNSEDREAVVKQFQEAQPAFKVTQVAQANLLPLTLIVSGLSFRIIEHSQDGKPTLLVEQGPDSDASELSNEVIKHVNERSKKSSLEVLLNMLASYQNLKFTPCDKCQSIFDDGMKYALVRRGKVAVDKDSKQTEWEVLHDGCIS